MYVCVCVCICVCVCCVHRSVLVRLCVRVCVYVHMCLTRMCACFVYVSVSENVQMCTDKKHHLCIFHHE